MMNINPLLHQYDSNSATTSAGSSNGAGNSGSTVTSTSSDGLGGSTFITLLTAELKAQDPTNPMDPTTMMSQLVQFNELQQTMDIDQMLHTALGSTTSTASQSTPNTLPNGGN